MIIQNILFPGNEFNPELEAYVRIVGSQANEPETSKETADKQSNYAEANDKKTNYAADINELVMQKGIRAEFNTYFNGLSIEKWCKYTQIGEVGLHLKLSGKFTIYVYNEFRAANKNVRKEICRAAFDGNRPDSIIEITIPDRDYRGMISFALESEADGSVFSGGYYYTTQEDVFENPCFAVDICTFKREKFVKRNMDLLQRTVFAADSPLKDCFEVFMSDNGQSLELDDVYGGKVHVFPNKNTGGAGGFGRAMIEILRSPDYEKFTHIIMMDDDIVFNYETLYRTFMMAKLLKDEYKNAFIGGAMLKSNDPKIQSEALDNWIVTKHKPVKFQYDITDLNFVLKNEIEDKGNYFSWWYCVMPIGVVKANNLPLPIFIKRDDIEYGVRNGRTFITLNGICVLHEAFELKRQGFLDYYYWRNICILNAIHFPSYSKEQLKKSLDSLMKNCLVRYRYDDANLAFTGVEDFLRGVDWLKNTDAEQLNNYVMNYTYNAQPTNTITPAFSHGAYEKDIAKEAARKKSISSKPGKSMFRKVAYGWLRRAKGVRYVKMNNPEIYNFYGVKRVINYDENSDKAFVTYKSWRELLNLLKNYKRICKLIDKKFDDVKLEYKYRAKEITSLPFWEKYLELDGTVHEQQDFAADTQIISGCVIKARKRKAAVRKRDKKNLRKVRIKRFMQGFLFWLPIKRNRICFYSHARKGYSCNLKYICEELLNRYGGKAEIIWITPFPESCTHLVQKGIKVVRFGTFEHWHYQFTSKVVVVNDAFPESVKLRRSQFTVNTWHASMNYKKIGPAYCSFRNDIAKKIFFIRNKQPKMYISGSQYFTEDTSKSFNFKKKIFVPYGMARNDIFFKNNAELTNKIKRQYALPEDCKLVLYAPTFRDGFKEDIHGIDFARLVKVLGEKFGGKWKVLYRKHYFVNSNDVILDKNTIDVSDYDDMNELLAVSDVLISDYSSCLWDFSITHRPSFIYATDMEQYHLNDRDFSYPVEKWPYTIAKDNDELEEVISHFNKADYIKKIKAHHADAEIFDDGKAAERAADAIAQKMKLKK